MALKNNFTIIQYRTEFWKLLDHLKLQGPSAEIGVAEGRFSAHIISWDQVTAHYMVDAWKQLDQRGDGGNPQEWHSNNYREALERTNNYSSKRIILYGLSENMIKFIPDNNLVFAYIDADHSYEGCLRDLNAIYPKVATGGIIAGHDFLNLSYGVHDAVCGFAKEKQLLVHTVPDVDESMSSFWMQK